MKEATPGGAPFGPTHAAECPLVKMIPLVIASNVPVDVNEPFATAGHVNTGLRTITPGPARVDASAAAGKEGVTTSWERELVVISEKQAKRKYLNNLAGFIWVLLKTYRSTFAKEQHTHYLNIMLV